MSDDSSDFSSLGYCIAESQCQWVLSVEREIREEDVKVVVETINGRQATCGIIVGLRGKWNNEDKYSEGLMISLKVIEMLFRGLTPLLDLYELAIKLPAPCDKITWPDVTSLKILYLEISGKRNWRLATLLNHLSLESFSISDCFETPTLVFEDCCAIAYTIFATDSLTKFCVPHCNMINVEAGGLQRITKALAAQYSLKHLELSGINFDDTSESNLMRMFRETPIYTVLPYIFVNSVCKDHMN